MPDDQHGMAGPADDGLSISGSALLYSMGEKHRLGGVSHFDHVTEDMG